MVDLKRQNWGQATRFCRDFLFSRVGPGWANHFYLRWFWGGGETFGENLEARYCCRSSDVPIHKERSHTHTKIKIKNDKKRKVIKWGHKARNKMESLERKEKRRLRDRNEVSALSSVWCPWEQWQLQRMLLIPGCWQISSSVLWGVAFLPNEATCFLPFVSLQKSILFSGVIHKGSS